MFDAYELRVDLEASKRLSAAGGVSLLLFAGLAVLTIVMSQRSIALPNKQQVDVSLRPPPAVKKPEPPPPPPAAPKVVRKALPPPPINEPIVPVPVAAAAPIEAPKQMPTAPVKEASAAEAVAARNIAVGGTGDGSGTAVQGGTSAQSDDESPAPVVATGGPVTLPEEAEPPEPADDNVMPEYPEVARASGAEAVVILKVVIEKNGTIGKVSVMKGEEPFVTAALNAVKTWKYTPATLDGAPISIFKIVKIPFRIRAD
jgi:periplasmic protein TonB